MRLPLYPLLRSECPLDLVREAVWRARKGWQKKQALGKLKQGTCPVLFRPIGYFRASGQLCSETARRTFIGSADLLLEGRFPVLGCGAVNLGMLPDWNCDFVSGRRWPEMDASLIQIVAHDGSDVKVPWELSRLQFLPVLAKAHRLTNERSYRDRAISLVSHWIDHNPVGVGVNWTIAMEVALRAISICLLLDLLWPIREDEQAWLEKVTRSLWQHLLYIEGHLEFSYLSRSNHYLSNIVGLLCLTTFLDGIGMKVRRQHYQSLDEKEILHQTYDDGADYEASTGYHVLVAQMFTCALLLIKQAGANADAAFVERLRKMYGFAAALVDPMGRIPHIGDCDDGRVELLLDDLDQMLEVSSSRRHSLAISNFLGIGSALFGDFDAFAFDDSLWYGLTRPPRPLLRERSPKDPSLSNRAHDSVAVFPESGVAIGRHNNLEVLFFAIPNGAGGKGSHTHNDKLSVVLRVNGEELFGDSGTGAYSRDWKTRNYFRSTGAHNTVLVDGIEQNRISWQPQRLFHIGNEARVSPIESELTSSGISLAASHSGYGERKVTHSRRLRLCEGRIFIEDMLLGAGEHEFELNLHIASSWTVAVRQAEGQTVSCHFEGPSSVSMVVSAPVHLALTADTAPMSRSYGSVFLGLCTSVRGRSELPVTIITELAEREVDAESLLSAETGQTISR
jgi:hypothetical protein